MHLCTRLLPTPQGTAPCGVKPADAQGLSPEQWWEHAAAANAATDPKTPAQLTALFQVSRDELFRTHVCK